METVATILMVLGSILILVFIFALLQLVLFVRDLRKAVKTFHRIVNRVDFSLLSGINSIINLMRKRR